MKSDNTIIGASLAEAGANLTSGLRKIFDDTHKTAVSQLKESTIDAEHQVFGIEGSLTEGNEVELGGEKPKQEQEKKSPSAEHRAYFQEILAAPSKQNHEEQQQLSMQIEEIRIEIKKLKDASAEMEMVFTEINTQQTPEKPGKYHLNFYEWVFLTIRNTREKMEEVNTLGAMVNNRKQEKQYMAMSKKHGTSFTLNNERAIARQSG